MNRALLVSLALTGYGITGFTGLGQQAVNEA